MVRFGFAPRAPAASPTDPLTIVTSRTPFFYLVGDLGITIGTGVSAWADQSGNGRDATQGTAGNQPTYSASDADFGGRASVSGSNGGGLFLDVAWNPPAPATTNVWFFLVLNVFSSGASKFVFCGSTGSNVLCLFDSSTVVLSQGNTTLANSNSGGAPAGTSIRGEVLFSGSTSDYTKFGSTTATGASAGNTDASIFRLFNRNGASQGDGAKIACIGAWAGEPSSGEKAALDAWVTSYYGPGVAV